MGNISLTDSTPKEKAVLILGADPDSAEIRISKLKDIDVLNALWDLATNKDDSAFKKMIRKRAKELGVDLVG